MREDSGWQSTSTEVAEREWDVIVVGAGPAGASTALHLAGRGHAVLALERHRFPREKVCGDALIPDAIAAIRRADLFGEVAAAARELPATVIYSPSRTRVELPAQFLTLRRAAFDAILARAAAARGATIYEARATGVSRAADGRMRVALADGLRSLRARAVVLATGADVALARTLGVVGRRGPSAVALRGYLRAPSIALDRLVLSFDRAIAPGYAWIFPLPGGELNVGCGVFYRGGHRPSAGLHELFDRFMSGFPLARAVADAAESTEPLRGAPLRCGLDRAESAGAEGVVAVGETIGATYPFSGEGIGKAMETGELAASLVDEFLRGAPAGRLRELPRRLEHALRRRYRGYAVAERWSAHPWLIDLLAARAARRPALRDVMVDVIAERADPSAVFSMRGLVRAMM